VIAANSKSSFVKQQHREENQDFTEYGRNGLSLVKYFKKSGSNSSLELFLKSYSPTRWNTVFYLLRSIEFNWSDISKHLSEKRSS